MSKKKELRGDSAATLLESGQVSRHSAVKSRGYASSIALIAVSTEVEWEKLYRLGLDSFKGLGKNGLGKRLGRGFSKNWGISCLFLADFIENWAIVWD
jgi:hypothetical protein